MWVQKDFGKHRQCVTIIFLVCSVTADFGWVLLVPLVLLVTRVIQTPNPLNSICLVNVDDHKSKGNPKYQDDPKNKNDSKMTPKMKRTQKMNIN